MNKQNIDFNVDGCNTFAEQELLKLMLIILYFYGMNHFAVK